MSGVVFLMGPTGVGKSALACALAASLPCEIVSVDSALIYRGLDIGTAKPNPLTRARFAHHLIDIHDVGESYSAAAFRADARAAIAAIHARGRLALLVGGTGLYFRALEHGLAELPPADPSVRARLAAELACEGAERLHARLRAADPTLAVRIHPHDPQRLLRALEIVALSGQSVSGLRARERLPGLQQPIVKVALLPADRRALRQRLARRFDAMLARGLVNEVAALRERGGVTATLPALRTVGYRDVWRYLEGEIDRAAMIERAVIATAQLAKRQMTWLRRESGLVSLSADDPTVIEQIQRLLRDRGIFNTPKLGLE